MSLSSQEPKETDTIAAIATPPGEGGIGIVRLSGARAIEITSKFFFPDSGASLWDQTSFTARMGKVLRAGLVERAVVDEALALVMRAPKTYTREDMVEIQAHGGTVVLRAILELALSYGARAAEPGEFTKRAFLSGRIDLLQAEAVLDLIHAKSEAGRAFAASQLGGALSSRIATLREGLIDILSHLETDIDFPDDFAEPDAAKTLQTRLEFVRSQIAALVGSSALGFVAKRGLSVVIWGRPNVGKSSLLNALARKNRVIVTPHPGTTRDVVEEEVEIGGFPVRLLDTAGVQETQDPIEKEGVERSRQAVKTADLVLHVLDASQPLPAGEKTLLEASSGKPRIFVLNKSDLPARLKSRELSIGPGELTTVFISTLTEEGVLPLEEALLLFLRAGQVTPSEEPVVTSLRQKDILIKVSSDLETASQALRKGLSAEFPAADVRRGLAGLGELTGEITNEEVLGRLFSQFCIGK